MPFNSLPAQVTSHADIYYAESTGVPLPNEKETFLEHLSASTAKVGSFMLIHEIASIFQGTCLNELIVAGLEVGSKLFLKLSN